MKATYFYAVVGGLLGGVALRSFLNGGMYLVLATAFLTLVLSAIYAYRGGEILFISALILLAVTLGTFRFEIASNEKIPRELRAQTERKVSVEGVVSEESIRTKKYQQLTVSVDRIGQKKIDETGVRVYANHYPAFIYGDRIRLKGELVVPENFTTDTGREFSYVGYLRKDGIRYQMFYPEIVHVSAGNGSVLKRGLFTIKHTFLSAIQQVIPEPHSALLGGITVGAEEALGSELEKKFRDTGLIHIVVLSGYNVTIVAESVMRLLSFAPMFFRATFGSVAIILFALLTGASATIVRASIMAVLVIIARVVGRRYQINRALLFAALIMVLHNPYILRFDPSFQLSFLATFGLINLGPIIETRLGWVPSSFQIRELAVATIATQIFVLPLLLFMTGNISLVSLPVNLLSLPLIPVSMLLGLLVSVTAFLSTAIAFPFAFLSFVSLEYVLTVVGFFSRLPFATVSVSSFSVWAMLLIYGIFFYIIFAIQKKKPPDQSL